MKVDKVTGAYADPAARLSLESRRQFPRIPSPSAPGSFSVLLPSPGTTPSDGDLLSHEPGDVEASEQQPWNESLQSCSVSSAESAGPSFAQVRSLISF